MRVFNVPASAPFLRTVIGALVDGALVEGFEARQTPDRLGEATLYLPTRRACRMARDMFLDVLDTDAVLLPRIVALGDIDEDELAFADAGHADSLSLALPLSASRRRLMLAPLIELWAEKLGSPNPDDPSLVVTGPISALNLADSLARLMDDMATRQVPWERLETLVPEDVDEYWQLTFKFLNFVVREHWPEVIKAHGLMEPVERRDELIALEAKRLAEYPRGPVIAAGSTGSMPATAMFLDAVARLPQGAVVLPGLDMDLDDSSWQSIVKPKTGTDDSAQSAPTHPQFAMQALLARMKLARDQVMQLAPARGREVLLSEAMRPAAATAQWRTRLAETDVAAAVTRGSGDLAVIAAATTEEEALAIAVALREAAEQPGKSAALVTPDRALARRVLAACTRWGLTVDDSGGDALPETQAGIFARLAAEAALDDLAPATLLALLKHPSMRLGREAGGFNAEIATLELALLRGTRPPPGCRGLLAAFAEFRAELSKLRRGEASAIHGGEPRAELDQTDLDSIQALIDALSAALEPLESLDAQAVHNLSVLAERHREVVAKLSIDATGEVAAFAEADGTALAATFDDLIADGAVAGFALRRGDYLEGCTSLLEGRMVRRPAVAGARLRIYGPLEARLTHCDRVILGGLVEGVWPPQTRVDPWLNRGMRAQLGLDLPERRIGLSAHDFAQLMGAPEVILSHAAKVGGAPSVASRFLHRLEAVMGKNAWDAATERGDGYLAQARALDRPAEVTPVKRPEPRPARALRPTRLSVTEIEHWLRDPYTIYARHILKLTELDPVDAAIGAADRGSVIHGAVGDFSRAFAGALPPHPFEELERLGRARFKPYESEPEARAFWWPRYLRIAQWLAGWEVARRKDILRIDAEITGSLSIDANGRDFVLRARADRIEQRQDGRYSLLDFKTGAVPTTPQVQSGLTPQLTLEGAILRAGGFGDIPTGSSIAELMHVKLSGAEPAGKNELLKLVPDDASDEALRKLTELVRAFEDEATPYKSMVLTMWSHRYGAYDDLARVKEWSATGGATGDGE